MAEQDATGTSFPVLEIEGPVARELPLEERYATLVNIYKLQYFATYRHIAQRFGWDAANEIAEAMAADAIPFIAEGYRRKFGLPGSGAALVSQVLATEFQVEGGDFETVHESEDEAEYKVLCTFGAALQSGEFDDARPVTKGLCDQGCWGFTQRVSETVKDGLHVEREAWMGDGAPRCHFTIAPRARDADAA
ncbi:MAG: hypothetical protein WD844_11620 [Thermoleophilaceae bacterium]